MYPFLKYKPSTFRYLPASCTQDCPSLKTGPGVSARREIGLASVPFPVKFEKGQDYELFYSHGCSVTLSEIKQENNTPKKVTLKRYYNQTENEGCSDAFKQVRIF